MLIDVAVSIGGQDRVAYFMQFPSPPREVGLSISAFWFLFTRARKLLCFIYTLLKFR
jgi:hypothetical protein